MSDINLKPCPFCGNSDRRVGIRRMGNKGYKIICGNCGAGGPYVAIKDWHDNKMIAQGQAVEKWNMRDGNGKNRKRTEKGVPKGIPESCPKI